MTREQILNYYNECTCEDVDELFEYSDEELERKYMVDLIYSLGEYDMDELIDLEYKDLKELFDKHKSANDFEMFEDESFDGFADIYGEDTSDFSDDSDADDYDEDESEIMHPNESYEEFTEHENFD